MRFAYKQDDKWVTVGEYKKNQWGNYQLSIRKTAFKEMFRGDGEYINLSVFTDEPKKEEAPF